MPVEFQRGKRMLVAGDDREHLIKASTPMTVVAEEDRIRANVYALLGNLLAAPPDETLLAALAAIDPAPADGTLLAASWTMLRDAATRAAPASVAGEYQDLFIGLGRGEVVPYGSWYVTGFLMEQPLARLRADLHELGIERQPGVSEPEDHAAALCDVMSLLIAGESPVALPRQQQFFARHLEPWVGRFFRDLQQSVAAHFYRAVGQLGEQFVEVERRAFDISVPAAGTMPARDS